MSLYESFLIAQHVSNIITFILKSWRLYVGVGWYRNADWSTVVLDVTLWKFFIAQHVSSAITLFLRSWRLYVGVLLCFCVYWCIGALPCSNLHSDTTLLQPNRTSTPEHTETEQCTHIQAPAPEDECNNIGNMLSN